MGQYTKLLTLGIFKNFGVYLNWRLFMIRQIKTLAKLNTNTVCIEVLQLIGIEVEEHERGVH